MENFLKFIEEDIEAKKTLLSTMPVNTKTNIKKFNEIIDSITEKYNEYKTRVRKYIVTKSKSFDIKNPVKNLEELKNKVNTLEYIRFVFNPLNTFVEKMGFDNLLFDMGNYYDFNFNTLNNNINEFLNKFDLAGVRLTDNDFDCTCYVHEYMTSFLEARNQKIESHDQLSEIFEKIYWVNPEIVQHIELNFRRLMKKHAKKFIAYIANLQKEVILKNNITDYKDCLAKLKDANNELNNASRENISDIINLAKTNLIDINKYFEDSKVRTTTYAFLMIDQLDLKDQTVMDKFYESLEKLKINIEEYNNYAKFLPLFDDLKKEYGKQVLERDKGSNGNNPVNNLKNIESQINDKENKLEKVNKKVFASDMNFLESKSNVLLRQLRIDSIKLAKELYTLYKEYDREYFKNVVLATLNTSVTISEILHLYYSFSYFKKSIIKRVFDITNYEEVIKKSALFDAFCMKQTNIIVDGISLFDESNIAKVIMNKYRLDNINLTEENLNPDDLESLLDKIQFLLRINEIEKSPTTVEKIWFMVQIEKIIAKEEKEEKKV